MRQLRPIGRCAITAFCVLLSWAYPAKAQHTWDLVGLDLTAEPAYVFAVKDIPFSVGFSFNQNAFGADSDAIPAGWQLSMEYQPPGGAAAIPKTVPLAWNGSVLFQAGPQEGIGSISGWRILDEQNQVIRVFTQALTVEVLGEILIPEVEINRLSREEMEELGVSINDDSYVGIQVDLALEIQPGETLDTEIVLIKNEISGEYESIKTSNHSLKFYPVHLVWEPPPRVRVKSSPDVVQATAQSVPRPRRTLPKLDALIVLPANIGYLHSFFKPTLILLNVAPEGTNYTVRNLSAEMSFDGDALRLPDLGGSTQFPDIEVAGPGPDGQSGTADDTNQIAPQQRGFASWVIEALKPGEQTLDFHFRGTILADDGASYPVTGDARGFLYIRRPEMSLHFDIPSVVREGEAFEIDAIFTNRNGVPVYDLRFDVDPNAIQGAQLMDITPFVNGSPASIVDLENQGDEALFRMNLISLSTGRVAVSQLSGGEDLGGPLTYSIHVAVGEHGLPLSAMTLIMPRALSRLSEAPYFFPNSVEADLKTVAGRALSLAQIPPGTEENGLRYIPEDAIKDWIQALTFAFLKPRSGTIEQQKRDLVLDFFFATLAQPKSLLDFLQQDSKYAEWAQTLAGEVNGMEDLMAADVMAPCLAFLVENDPMNGASGALSFGPFGNGSDVTGTFFRDDFEYITWQPTSNNTSGWFFDGRRWGRFTFNTQGGELTVIWNGFNLEFIEAGMRVYPEWVWGDPQPPTLLAARQVGVELLTIDPDLYGRQVLLYFSAPVALDESFASRFDIDNNQVLRADRLTDHIVQIWARNPLGLVERDISMDDGVQSVGGTPLEPAIRAIQMSEYLRGTTVEGIVLGPNGQPVPAAEVRLIQTARRLNNAPPIEFDGYDELAAGGNDALATQIRDSLELLAQQRAQNRKHGASYTQEFGALTGLDGSYLLDYWPFYRKHDDPRYLCCDPTSCGSNHYPCSEYYPDLLWSVRWNGRQVDRRIYGRFAGQAVRYDFVFTPRGEFNVHIPPLASGEEPEPEDIVYIQALDQDEFLVSHALLPGETIEFNDMRLGPISILAQGVGGFDAHSFTLGPDNLGTTITLDPATVPGVLTAQMRELDENGDTVPLTTGAILVRHYGTVFGGIPPNPNITYFAGVNLNGFADGNAIMEVPEGTMDVLYRHDWRGSSIVDWRTVEVHAGETVDLGTFLYTPEETGTVTAYVQDSLGAPLAGIEVFLSDGHSATIQETDENGVTVFEGVMVGIGAASVSRHGVTYVQQFSLASPNQLETQISFLLDAPFSLDVHVVDETGDSLSNAWVEVTDQTNPMYPRFPDQSALTDQNGHIQFEWVGFVPDFEYPIRVNVQHPVNFRTTAKIYTRPLDEYAGQTTVTFPESGLAELTVYSEDTLERLENVWVEVKDSSDSVFANVTDVQGDVSFGGLNPGTADITMLPSQGLRVDYVKTETSIQVTSGETFVGDLLLQKKRVIIPRYIDLAGQVFDAMNQPFEDQIKYRLSVVAHFGAENVEVDIGDYFTTETGAIDLHDVEIPSGAFSYTFKATSYDDDTGRYGEGKWLWDQRLTVPFLPIQLHGNIQVPVRVWDTLGRRVSVGSVHFEQAQVIDNSMQQVTLEEIVTLSEQDYEPTFQVRTQIPYCITYEGPSSPAGGFCERTVAHIADDGRPIDIVIRPLSELEIGIKDESGQPITEGIFLQVFKGRTLWQEQRFEPDAQTGLMSVPDLPLGNWAVLAMQISTGITDVWYGTVGVDNERIQLTIRPGQDFIGSVVNNTGTPVPDAQMTLARKSGSLAYSGSQISGISNQELLGTSDENGLFSFPVLTRGSYILSVYDPFTNRHKSVEFSVPETEDLQVVMPPVGRIHLTGFLPTGDLAVGAKLIAFRGINRVFAGYLDGATGDYLSPFLPAGPLTFMLENADNTFVGKVHAEVVSDQTTEFQVYLDTPEYQPLIGFQWDTNENIEERIHVDWRWTGTGGLASRQGTVIYPDGTPIQFDFLEGRVHLRVQIEGSQDHGHLVREYTFNLDDPEEDFLFTVQLPRILEVTVVDQTTMAPIEGAIVSGRTRAYTDASGLARIKNITKGENLSLHIVTLDDQYYGAANVIISDDVVTRVTVPVNSNVGDLDFQFVQRGFPHKHGLIELNGHGVNFVRVLDGNDRVGFRFVIQGNYSYRYVDPLSGVLVTGDIDVVPGNTASQTIEVPGSSPLLFLGEFDGGIPLVDGQVIQVETQLKTFTAEVSENSQGIMEAYFPLLPEGSWPLSTPTIPTNDWNPQVNILFGTVNRYEALGALALPFWVRANVFFADFWDVPVTKFIVRRFPYGGATAPGYYRYFSGGLGVMSLPPGDWRLRFEIIDSPIQVWSDVISVTSPDQVFEVREKIDQETASVRISARDTSGAFVNSFIRVSSIGTTYSYKSANPFLDWNYLPTNSTTTFTVAQTKYGSGAREVRNVQLAPGYQEISDIVLDIQPPAGNLTMNILPGGQADFIVTTDKPAADVRGYHRRGGGWMNFEYDSGLDQWTHHMDQFKRPWTIGPNEFRLELTNLSSARTTETYFLEWPTTTTVDLNQPGPFESLPQSLEFRVSDPSFVLDPNRLTYTGSDDPEPHHVRVNYRDVPFTVTPEGDGLVVDVAVLIYPWQLDINAIDVLMFDLDGNPAGMTTEVIFQNLPQDGIVNFTNLAYGDDPDIDVTIHARAPDGTESTYQSLGQSSFTLNGLPFGDWQFYLVNNHPTDRGVRYHFHHLDQPGGVQFATGFYPDGVMEYTVLNRFGQPYPGVEVHLQTHGNELTTWDHGSQITDANGQVRWADLRGVYNAYYDVTVDFGNYSQSWWHSPSARTVQDPGGGDILVRAMDAFTNNEPIPGLEIYFDDELMGTTDLSGEWTSDLYYIAGTEIDLRVEGTTTTGGDVLYEETIIAEQDRLDVPILIEPYYEGQLDLTMGSGFDSLIGTFEIENHSIAFPFSGTLSVPVEEGQYDLEVTTRWGDIWFNVPVNIVRNQVTPITVNGPPPSQTANVEIHVETVTGDPIAQAQVVADGVVLGLTDATGLLSIPLFPSDYRFVSAAPEGRARLDMTLTGGQVNTVTLVASEFSAQSIADNLLWLTVDPGTLLLDESRTERWVDLSGNGNHATQDDEGRMPTFTTATTGDHSVLRFDGVDDYLDLPVGFENFNFGLTAIFVVRMDEYPNGTNYGTFMDLSQSGGAYQIEMQKLSGQRNFYYRVEAPSGQLLNADDAISYYRTNIYTVHHQGNAAQFLNNHEQVGLGTVHPPTSVLRDANRIGAASYGGRELSGEVVEIMLFNRALNQTELNVVHEYLAEEHGIYDPNAAWLSGFSPDELSTIQRQQLSRAEAQRYAGFASAHPDLPVDGLSFWAHADGQPILTDSTISGWEDLSYFQRPAVPGRVWNGDTYDPVFPDVATDVVEGHAVWRFDGSQHFRIRESGSEFASDGSLFMVINPIQGHILGIAEEGSYSPFIYEVLLSGEILLDNYLIHPGSFSNKWSVMAFEQEANGLVHTRVNGQPNPVRTEIELEPDISQVFIGGGSYNALRGDVAEVLVYDRVLTQDEKDRVELFLAAKYGLEVPLPAPTFDPPGGIYSSSQTVALNSVSTTGLIHYTLDGSLPDASSASVPIGGTLSITQDTVLRARLIDTGLPPGSLASATYLIGDRGSNAYIATADDTIWAVGTTGQDVEGMDVYVSGATVTSIGEHDFASLTVINGGVLTHRIQELPGVSLTVTGDVWIDHASRIDVSERGYVKGSGPGSSGGSYSAGYGGRGGGGVNGGPTYGDPYDPRDLGSGGGRTTDYAGGTGGGAVVLEITGTLTLDGTIEADGGGAKSYRSGSGGSVNINAQRILGNGTISAHGGDYNSYGWVTTSGSNGGGGGRVALTYDEAGSTFHIDRVNTRNGLFGDGESGTIVINGAFHAAPVELLYKLVTGQSNTVGRYIRLNHTDGREIVEVTDSDGNASFDGIRVGDVWDIHFSMDGSKWYFVETLDVGQREYIRDYVHICMTGSVEFQARYDLRGKELEWFIDGQPAQVLNVNRDLSSYDWYRLRAPIAGLHAQVQVFLPGFSTPMVDQVMYIDCSQDNRVGPSTWPSSRIYTVAADGESSIPYAPGVITYLVQLDYVSQTTGAEVPFAEPGPYGYISARSGSLYLGVRTPIDGSVALRYRFMAPDLDTLIAEGLALPEDGEFKITLPFSVLDLQVMKDATNPIPPFKYGYANSATGYATTLDSENHIYKIVNGNPHSLHHEVEAFFDDVSTEPKSVDATALVDSATIYLEPHHLLEAPQQTVETSVDVYVGDPSDLAVAENLIGEVSYEGGEKREEESNIAHFSVFDETAILDGPVPFYLRENRLWAASSDWFPTRYGLSGNLGEQSQINWTATDELTFGDLELRWDDTWIQSLQSTEISYQTWDYYPTIVAFSEATGSRLYGGSENEGGGDPDDKVQGPVTSYLNQIPIGHKAWFMMTLEWESGPVFKSASDLGTSRTMTWLLEKVVTADDITNGIDLSFEPQEDYVWDVNNGIGVGSGFISARQDISGFIQHDLEFSWNGKRFYVPTRFAYNRLGWIGFVETQTSTTDNMLAFRNTFIDFSGRLGGNQLTLPITFRAPSGSSYSSSDGMATKGFRFGILTGAPGAQVEPTLDDPSEEEYLNESYLMMLQFTLPAQAESEWNLVFPIMVGPLSDDPVLFNQDFQDWKTAFPNLTDPFWLELPQEWRDAAQNWLTP